MTSGGNSGLLAAIGPQQRSALGLSLCLSADDSLVAKISSNNYVVSNSFPAKFIQPKLNIHNQALIKIFWNESLLNC